METIVDRIRHGLEYQGGGGQWAWLFHRFSGLLTVVFIVTHVLDSTLITFFPRLYQKTIKFFKHPLAAVAEIGLIGAVLYHAINGLRVTILDLRPKLWRRQKEANQVMLIVYLVLFVPMAFKMILSLFGHQERREA